MPGEEKPESRFLRRLTSLEQARKPWEDEWQDITRLILPRRDGWDERPSDDKRQSKDIFDGTALAALTLMSDGLLGHLVPASIPFFRFRPALKAAEEYKPLRLWLDACRDHVLQVLERSNFYSALGEVFPDAGSLGTACMFVEEDIASAKVYFSVLHLKEVFVAENRWGEVDTVYRKFQLPLETLVEMFGDALDERMLDRAEKRPDDFAKVLHAVEPDKTGRRKWSSTYILLDGAAKGDNRILSEGGYDWMPFVVWRFRKNSDEVYGRSPAMDALYDVAMINHQAKTMAEAAHKAVDPPLIAHESMRGKIKLNPRGITYWDQFAPGGALVGSLYGQGGLSNYPLGIDAMERRAKIIREHFRSDFFSYLLADGGQRQDRTATEVNAIEAQKAAVLGATIGRVNKELLEPSIANVFAIEMEAGRLPEIPEELAQFAGMPIEVEYTGPLAQKQKQYLRSQGVMDGIAAASAIVQGTGRMEIFDLINFDRAGTQAMQANGMADDMLLDERMVQKIRKHRAAAQAAMQDAQLQLEAAKVSPDPNKAPEPGSPAEEARHGAARPA